MSRVLPWGGVVGERMLGFRGGVASTLVLRFDDDDDEDDVNGWFALMERKLRGLNDAVTLECCAAAPPLAREVSTKDVERSKKPLFAQIVSSF